MLDRARIWQRLRCKPRAERIDTVGAEVTFSRYHMIFAAMREPVGVPTLAANFLGARDQQTNSAPGMTRQRIDQARRARDDRDTRAVINRALPQIPRIQVRGE